MKLCQGCLNVVIEDEESLCAACTDTAEKIVWAAEENQDDNSQ